MARSCGSYGYRSLLKLVLFIMSRAFSGWDRVNSIYFLFMEVEIKSQIQFLKLWCHRKIQIFAPVDTELLKPLAFPE